MVLKKLKKAIIKTPPFRVVCFAVDDKKAERTLEVFPTAEQAARAHDVAALRQYGLPAQTMLNHPLESYSEVSSISHLDSAP